MEFGWVEGLVSAGLLGAGTLLAEIRNLLKGRSDSRIGEQKAASDVAASEVEKASALQRDIIAQLRADIDEMFGLYRKLEDERLACREDAAGLRVENKNFRTENKSLRDELVALRARHQ